MHAPLPFDARRLKKIAQDERCTPLYFWRRSSVEKKDQTDARRLKFRRVYAQEFREDARPPLNLEFFRVLWGIG